MTVNYIPITPKIIAEKDETSMNVTYKALITYKNYSSVISVIPTIEYLSFDSDYSVVDFLLTLYQQGYKFFDTVKYRSFGNFYGYINATPIPLGGNTRQKRGKNISNKAPFKILAYQK